MMTRSQTADLAPQLSALAQLMTRHCGTDGIHVTAVPGMALLRQSTPMGEPIHAVHQPAMCLIVQGIKRVMLGGEIYDYDASRYLVVSVDVPVSGQVTGATAQMPYLCIRLDIDPGEIAALLLQSGLGGASAVGVDRALAVSQSSAPLLDAVLRMVQLLDAPEDIQALAPLARREILYRLLKGEQSAHLHQIATTDGPAQRIARAINWLKAHYDERLRIETLARDMHMSPSSLHHHFKAVTGMSPLQFQKQLRLQAARQLMLTEGIDAATAGHRVGYESPSQFGREYVRLFGVSPVRDLRRLRERMPDQAHYV